MQKAKFAYDILQDQRAAAQSNIKTDIITDQATGKQQLINLQT